MDYKSISAGRILCYIFKLPLLRAVITDKGYLKLQYRVKMGGRLRLAKPRTFNEKMQWLKLNERKPLMSVLVDKYEARKYIKKVLGSEYLIPIYGCWERFEDIDFSKLPNSFVLKCTSGSGDNIVCRNKSMLNMKKAKKVMDKALKKNYYWGTREWPYKNVKPRIIAEKYIDTIDEAGLIDYKFYCFNGKPELLYVSQGLEDHSTAKISFLNLDYTKANFRRSDYQDFDILPPKPHNYDKMLEIAGILSKGWKFVRIDLYEINDKVYFSEITFYPCGGYMPFEPEEYDMKIGKLLQI